MIMMRRHRSSVMSRLGLGIQVASATMLGFQLVSAMMPRQLSPTPLGRKLLQHVQNTNWNRELQVASNIVASQRRRHRQRTRRHLRDGKYNDYLPEDNPELLLDALSENMNDSSSSSSQQKCMSPLQKWFVSLIETIGIDTWDEIEEYNITSLAYLYKHHVSSADGINEYFGTYGERTQEMKENHASLTSFWYNQNEETVISMAASGHATLATPTSLKGKSDVILLGMHGVDIATSEKLVPTLQQMYGLDGAEAYAVARSIQAIIESLPGAFNNPILTANAIAIQSLNPDGSKSERDSIIMGDGVFSFLEWLNLKKDGPDYIHAHEFGHHLQYDLGINKMGNGWSMGEETRRWEIMADVFGGYYLAHSRGGRMESSRLHEVHRAAFSLGDCENGLGSHHGTPRQRECASNYGANLALASYLDKGYIISAEDLKNQFDEMYEEILTLDEEQCEAVLDASTLDTAIYGEIIEDSEVGSSSDGSSGASSSGTTSNIQVNSVPAPSPGESLYYWGTPTSQEVKQEPWGNGVKYEPWGNDTPSSSAATTTTTEYKPWSEDNHGSATFEAYNPDDNSQPENELDKPPERKPANDHSTLTQEEEDGWFGKSENQWVAGRTTWSSSGSSADIGWPMGIAAVSLKMILFLWYL